MSYSRAVGVCAIAAFGAALAGCGDEDCAIDYCDGCTSACASTEVSYGLVAGDFTGNGFPSVIQTSAYVNGYQPYPGNLKAFLSTGAGAFGAPALTGDGYDPLYLAAADLNGDHLPDIVSASFDDGALAVFFNDAHSPGSFAAPLRLPSPGASQIAVADMNGDGLPDLVSADFNVSLFLQTSPGTFGNPISLYPGGANWVAAADLNGDGIPDVAVVDQYGVKLLLHTGASSVSTYAAPVPVYTEGYGAWYSGANVVAIADVNGDGLNDLLVTDPGPAGGGAPTVAVLLQNPAGPGTFLGSVSYATAAGSLAESIVVTDVNADGHPDIVIGGSAAVTVLLQNAAAPGTFMAAVNYTVTNANEIAVADVNADGLPDIVAATGLMQPAVNGVVANQAGVLLQAAGSPGTFTSLQNLP